jgi:hypothetical protein
MHPNDDECDGDEFTPRRLTISFESEFKSHSSSPLNVIDSHRSFLMMMHETCRLALHSLPLNLITAFGQTLLLHLIQKRVKDEGEGFSASHCQ